MPAQWNCSRWSASRTRKNGFPPIRTRCRAASPKLLIADEPTTALDVTIQKQILDLLMSLQVDHGMGMIMITHNMGVVAETADRVIVQYKGRKMEEADVLSLFEAPKNAYTRALLAALPDNATGDRLPTIAGLMLEGEVTVDPL